MMIDFQKAVELLRNAEDVLVYTHANPDGDTLGSGYALVRALQKMGKNAMLLNSDTIPSKYAYLEEYVEYDDIEADFIVSVDVAEKKLLGDRIVKRYGGDVDLCIDHHSSHKLYAKNSYIEPDSASTCEIVYLLIKALGVEIDKGIADCIYTGCSTDTGCFRYSNVTARTHRIVAELIEAGADHSGINVRMFETKSLNQIQLERMCLEKLECYDEGRLAVITVTKDMMELCGADKSALDTIKPLTRQIQGVSIGVTVKYERPGVVGVSVRTDENYDASAICAHFGGGGHVRAAGCEFKGLCENEVKDTVVEYITQKVL